MAFCNSCRISFSEPMSFHVTSGTVANPSLFAEGCTTRRAASKSLCSIHKADKCSGESGGSVRNQVRKLAKSDNRCSC